MNNYHSSLPSISKYIEMVLVRHIEKHLKHSDLHDSYPRRHSTEIVLLKEDSDIPEAFDVIDHLILLKHLEHRRKGFNLAKVCTSPTELSAWQSQIKHHQM